MELYDFFLYNMIPLIILHIKILNKIIDILRDILHFILAHFNMK